MAGLDCPQNINRQDMTRWLEQAQRDPGFLTSILDKWTHQVQVEFKRELVGGDHRAEQVAHFSKEAHQRASARGISRGPILLNGCQGLAGKTKETQ